MMRRLLDTKIGRAITARHRRAPRTQPFVFHYEHVLGTSLELKVDAESESAARCAESIVLAEVDRLESVLSGWSHTSELARWQATHDVAVPVSPDLADVLHASDAWRARTGGAFNPAAQAIIELLRDGDARDVSPALLEELRGPLWQVDRGAGTARRLVRHAVSLDAIAKGHIVSRAAAHARDVGGVTGVLLNIGGDLQHLGTSAALVGIADPSAPAENSAPIAVVRIRNAALATSGGYRRGFVLDGRRVSHIVDPRSGQPAQRVASASVFAPDCADADALSTAFSVMDPHDSVALADSLPGVGCLIIVESGGAMMANDVWNAHAITPRYDKIHSRY